MKLLHCATTNTIKKLLNGIYSSAFHHQPPSGDYIM